VLQLRVFVAFSPLQRRVQQPMLSSPSCAPQQHVDTVHALCLQSAFDISYVQPSALSGGFLEFLFPSFALFNVLAHEGLAHC
jgi:hypothetical protein